VKGKKKGEKNSEEEEPVHGRCSVIGAVDVIRGISGGTGNEYYLLRRL
jgi:hypothetical protein